MKEAPGIVLIGAGRVGSHLARRLVACGLRPVQIFNRTLERALILGQALQVPLAATWEQLLPDANLYLIAVRDDAIPQVAAQLAAVVQGRSPLVVHTSGATPMQVLQPFFARCGVFYPVQTFSAERQPDFTRIPICIFAQHANDVALLRHLALRVSGMTYEADDEQRLGLHVAAVFVNNFVNYLYSIGQSLMQEAGLPFELLWPLIVETAEKIQAGIPPSEAQTGPAYRGDAATVQRHLQYLQQHAAYRKIYRMLSININPVLEQQWPLTEGGLSPQDE